MRHRNMIKAAKAVAVKPSLFRILQRETVKSASARNYINAVKAVYHVKMAEALLHDQAQYDPDMARTLYN